MTAIEYGEILRKLSEEKEQQKKSKESSLTDSTK